jgi:hypothetical protein
VDDVRVVEARDDQRFALEMPDDAGVVGEVVCQHLDRHRTPERGLHRQIHGRHAALADLADQLVLARKRLRQQCMRRPGTGPFGGGGRGVLED